MNFSFGSHYLGIDAPNPDVNYSYNGYGICSNLNTPQIDLTIKLEDILMDVQLVQAIQQTQIYNIKLINPVIEVDI